MLVNSRVTGLAALLLLTGCGSSAEWQRDDGTQSGGTGGTGDAGGTGGTGDTGDTGGSSNDITDAGSAGSSEPPDPVPPDPTGCAVPGTSQIPRLTNEQYDRTVRDLLGVTTILSVGLPPSGMLAPDDPRAELTERAWAGYAAAGEAIAVQVMADATLRGRFLACTPSGDGTECLHESIVSFGRRAFRRPLTDAELARFDAIVAQGPQITETGAPEEVAEVLLETFLVSPSFLQRSEISAIENSDGNYVLSSHEVAARLSYMLWGSAPDEILDRAADAGALSTQEQILAQAERLLADPRAREVIRAFHRSYVQAGAAWRWESIERDPQRFPAFTSALAPLLLEETERFFETVVFDRQGVFSDLFSSTVGFVNADTAPFYGLDPAAYGAELAEVNLDPVQRPGFLTRLGFLTAYSNYDKTSPILRGSFIENSVLGLDLESAHISEVEPPDGEYQTNRQWVEANNRDPVCAGCHAAYLDPPGFVLEAFDAVGVWQTREATTLAPIDTVAEVRIDGSPTTVVDPADLMRKLAASSGARRAYARSWFSYAYEREVDPLDTCALEALTDKLTDDGYTVLNLVADLTQTATFSTRARVSDP